MIAVRFTPSFVRQIQSLSDEIQEEIFQNIHQFVNDLNTQPVFSVEDSLAWEIY